MTATMTPTIPEKVVTRPRMATDIPASITTPDRVETRLGTLGFFDGFPDEDRNLIGSLWRDLGTSVIMSSHLLRDIERVCDRVIIIGHYR